MDRNEAITRLKSFEARIREMGATALFLFGSIARNQAQMDSDLDLFVEYDPDSRFNLLDLIAVKHLVEDDFHMPVDVATRDGLHPRMRDEIERDAIKIF